MYVIDQVWSRLFDQEIYTYVFEKSSEILKVLDPLF
jgi:hypothetical protein